MAIYDDRSRASGPGPGQPGPGLTGGGLGPAAALRRIAFLLERGGQPTYRIRAFRAAAGVVDRIGPDEAAERAQRGTLQGLAGIGSATAQVITEAIAGAVPAYLARAEADWAGPLAASGLALRRALRGDCHTHSDWSDGGSPIEEMAEAARALGHEYLVLTDHSQRLTVARGLSRDRLARQVDIVQRLNEELAPFRVLTGMEVDILEDGSLDMDGATLGRLDLVVASVHSKLRMESPAMTRRMVAAVANPHSDVLGHCTGRMVTGRARPESTFDADIVFAACARFDKAVEVNSRPERLDPPRRLLALALDYGCRIAIDSDAHAPGQLDWLAYGCARAEECGVTADRVVNTMPATAVAAWAATHDEG